MNFSLVGLTILVFDLVAVLLEHRDLVARDREAARVAGAFAFAAAVRLPPARP